MIDLKIESEQDMIAFGQRLSSHLNEGDLVLFEGELGSGKTTLIRGILQGLEWKGAVRSPTFNLFSVYDTKPKVLHADLFRISSARGTGIEDYFDDYLCLIEWPDAMAEMADLNLAKRVTIMFDGDTRRVRLSNISL